MLIHEFEKPNSQIMNGRRKIREHSFHLDDYRTRAAEFQVWANQAAGRQSLIA
jgi:hypothetical protein